MNDSVTIKKYKSYFASRYQFLTKENIEELPSGQLFVSKKYDGYFCCAIISDGKNNELMLPNGDSISADFLVVKELKKLKRETKILVAGELFVAKPDGRERSGEVKTALANKSDHLSFVAFDIIESADEVHTYEEKLQLMENLFSENKHLLVVSCESLTKKEVPSAFEKLVTKEKNEGVIIRNDNKVYKVKNEIDLDCVVLAYTINSSKTLRSVSVGLALDQDSFLHIGAVGSFKSSNLRDDLYKKLSDSKCSSPYRLISTDGTQYQFVIPKVVVEINTKDIQNELSTGEPVQRMSFALKDEKLTPIHEIPSVSILHTNVANIRDDKNVLPEDCGINQLERVGFFINDIKTNPNLSLDNLKESEVLSREVYTKDSKGKTMIKKFLILETKKELFGYPRYLFYFFDFSETRKDPIKRDVRPFAELKTAKELMFEYIAINIKKGWVKI